MAKSSSSYRRPNYKILPDPDMMPGYVAPPPPPYIPPISTEQASARKAIVDIAKREQAFSDMGKLLEKDPLLDTHRAASLIGADPTKITEREATSGRIIGASAIPVQMERYRTLADIGIERRRHMIATAMDKWEDIMAEVDKPKDLQQMVASLGVLIDKSRLETGEVTERIEQLSRFENRHTLELEARARLVDMFPDVAAALPPPTDPIEDEHRETLRQMREEKDALERVGVVDRSLWKGLKALSK